MYRETVPVVVGSWRGGGDCFAVFFYCGTTALVGSRPSQCSGWRSQPVNTYNIRQNSSGRGIRPSQRPLRNNTQHLQGTDIHAFRGLRNRNAKKGAAADMRLRSRGHRNGHHGVTKAAKWSIC
jgi:hypothetical protein